MDYRLGDHDDSSQSAVKHKIEHASCRYEFRIQLLDGFRGGLERPDALWSDTHTQMSSRSEDLTIRIAADQSPRARNRRRE
jgi:hypothetical protein